MPNSKRLTVLCVDDDPDIRDVIEMSLRLDANLDTIQAGSGEAALDMLESGLRPDVVLLDLRMNGIGGLELARRLLARDGNMRPAVIFLTAAAMARDLASMLATGVAGVLIKPFDPLLLAADVRRVLSDYAARDGTDTP